MKIILSVVISLTSFMSLKESEFLCMVLIKIVFLVPINLARLYFSYVLMELVKSISFAVFVFALFLFE